MTAKIYFRYGVMGSGKSTQLLQIAHDYEANNNKKVMVLKPSLDTKANDYVTTRMGDGEFKRKCDFLILPKSNMLKVIANEKPDLVMVDEAQFLTKENVWDLVKVATELDIPVICFGLKVSFSGEPFEGSTYLFALAHDIEEIQTRALSRAKDNTKRATMNLRLVNGKPTFEGDTVLIDGSSNVEYIPVSLATFVKCKRKCEKEQVKS